ncbi:hypothetical protein [Glacieibacterium frigidum]|uniref:Uncharacterized protein n=1 Tax=Glacieibacterium frigidum TaxID=2593303 RepID=A0A552UFJ1_9SPHN|nr:hypothetical protein [Glacieibacterium frigidum]TRW16997.1 hypothetical protein FMM06_01950 [Glacieibacterium frigidum]
MLVALGLAACSPGFDAPRWAAERGNATGVNARLDMVASLGSVGVAVGTSRPRVRAALGLPDGEGPREDIYYLGRNDMAPDYLVLAIGYTAGGRVAVLRTREL